MIKIYSKVEEGKLLHMIHTPSHITEQRTDLVEPDQFIQCSFLHMSEGTTFKPHQHIWKEPTYKNTIAQESWVVIRGAVEVFFYDTDSSFLESHVLEAGDASFTLEGGHTYEILKDGTMVYEYKTGPYEGQERDKEFI